MTLIELLRDKQIPEGVRRISDKEHIALDFLVKGLIDGAIVIPQNSSRHPKKPCAIGAGLRTKVNANIGTSPSFISIKDERDKLFSAFRAGVDTVMDLSTGGNISDIRKMMIEECPLPFGTVPIYQACCDTVQAGKKMTDMDPEKMFEVIEEQCADGVDFITVHCGVTLQILEVLEKHKRITGIVSRGGSFLAKWMRVHKQQNPLYEQFDRLVAIAKKHDVTLSLGDGLRPGCLADASDSAQLTELSILGELVLKARKESVQVIIEGPGHMPMDQIEPNVNLAKRLGYNSPLYFLGPLVTDVAPGYDHITSAIGGAIAARAGVDFLCYVTPVEHLGLPDASDVIQGVMASRIAAHAADIAKGVKGARDWDDEFSGYRKSLDWKRQSERAMDLVRFQTVREKHMPAEGSTCTMCGEFCAMRDEAVEEAVITN
jgi:phosphomethylpyrimidine synthase